MQTRAATCPRTRQLVPHLFSRNEQLLSCIANLQLWIPALQRRFSTQFSLKSHRSSGKFEQTFHGSPLMMWQTDSFGDASISRTDSCQLVSRSILGDTYEFLFYPPQLRRTQTSKTPKPTSILKVHDIGHLSELDLLRYEHKYIDNDNDRFRITERPTFFKTRPFSVQAA